MPLATSGSKLLTIDSSLRGRLLEPRRNVPRRMQDPPDVDVRISLNVENQIRKPPRDRRAQTGKIQLTLITGRTACGVLGHTAEGFFQRVDEGQGNRRSRLGERVLDGLVDIAPSPLAKDDRFPGHPWLAWRTRSRSRPK